MENRIYNKFIESEQEFIIQEECNMINLFNRKTVIEKELCGTTKIFGDIYNIEVIYKKITNPE